MKPRYHCMTCGLDFETKPETCPSCGQSKFADRSDEESDAPGPPELKEEEEDSEEEDSAPPHSPGDPAPRTRRKTSRTLKRKR
jgi:predicted  nucleic acid-binding Zn-ribbon protein